MDGADDGGEAKGVSLLSVKGSLTASQRGSTRQMKASPEKQSASHRVIPVSGCQYTFLDIGANSGDTVNLFIHADDADQPRRVRGEFGHWDPMDPTVGDFDYGPWQDLLRQLFQETKTRPSSYCVVGIEANKAWAPHYQRFQKHHAKKVQQLSMHSGIALGDTDGTMDFTCAEPDPLHGVWADGQPDEDLSRKGQFPCVVKSRSLPSMLQELHGQSAKILIVKMDVESKINDVLPEFLQSGAIEALGAEGVHTYMVVDTQHMNDETLKIWGARENTPTATFYDLTVA